MFLFLPFDVKYDESTGIGSHTMVNLEQKRNDHNGHALDCWYPLELPRRGGSNKYPQSMLWSKNKKNR